MIIDPKENRITGADEEHLGLDEIVAAQVDFHMERMDDNHMWFALYDDARHTMRHVHLYAKDNRLIATVMEEEFLEPH